MTDPAKLPVRPDILVVPDGGDADTVRFSLRVTPAFVPAGTTGAIALAQWPEAIARLASSIVVEIASIKPDGTLDGSRRVGTYPVSGVTGTEGPMRLWGETFTNDQLNNLWEVLADPEGRQAGNAAGPAIGGPVLAPSFDVATLGEALLRNRAKAAAAQASRLLDKGNKTNKAAAFAPAPPPPALDAPMTELEAWAVPGTARDSLGRIRENALRLAQGRQVKAAVTDALRQCAVAPFWQGIDSHALLDAIQRAERLDGRSDPFLAKAVEGSAPKAGPARIADRMESLLLAETSIARAVAGAAAAPADEPYDPLADPKVEKGENERRKFGAILSSPTIAKYLGMVLDVSVPRRDWDAAKLALGLTERGAVTASLPGAMAGPAVWTAWLQFTPGLSDSRPAYFGPCDMAEALGKGGSDQKFIRGMLNLRARYDAGGTPAQRYVLEVLDVINSAMRQRHYAQGVLEARRRGDLGDEMPPELGGRGIALLDKDCGEDEARAVERQKLLEASGKGPKLLFADDLVAGYRPAVGIALNGADGLAVPLGRWRSLVGRSLEFDGAIDDEFLAKNFNAEREHGHTRSPIGRQPGTILQRQEMFVWTGESLAAPAPKEREAQSMPADSTNDLPIGMTYGLPTTNPRSPLSLPPLREGRAYVFGASAMFVNGCGLTIDDAMKAHAADSAHLLGGADNRAFPFRRAERIPAPVVLLRAGTRLVTTSNLEQLPGESLTTLVVRESGPKAERYLFPARVEFDRAEQQAMFGRDDRNVPRGAFQRIGARRHEKSGDFARAIEGQVDTEFRDRPGEIERSRGPVLEFEPPSVGAVDREYYPDAWSRGVWTRFSPVVPSNGQIAPMASAVPFRSTDAPVDSLPVMLELKRGAPGGGLRGQIDERDKWSPDAPQGQPLRKISIELAPATVVEVSLDSDFNAAQILEQNLIAGALAAEWNDAALNDKEGLAKRLESIVAAGRLDELQGAGKLRLVHAVERPLKNPVDVGIVPILVTVAPEGEGSQQLGTWTQTISDNQGKPLNEWSQEGGATCFFGGPADLDAPSTGSLGLDARWEEWGPEMVRLVKGANPPWTLDPSKQIGRLFTLSELESANNRTGSMQVDRLGLLLDPEDQPRSLSFTFRDGRARRLETKLVAVTRFLEYYSRAGATSSRPFAEGRCERLSERFREIWIPCTFRPAPPQIERITPWFTYAPWGEAGDQEFGFTRRTSYRVELDRDCFGSGEGEMIGLVFNPAMPPVCDYAKDVLRPFAAGVTRWGRDPLHEVAVPAENISPERFQGYERTGKFDLLAGADPVTGAQSPGPKLPVTVLGFPIGFDGRKGQFYCDIQVAEAADSSDEPYMPFVQLGLVRFQPNCVAGLELSLPVGETIQLLPVRRGTVRFRKKGDGHRFSFKLKGPRDRRATTRLDLTALEFRLDGPDAARWMPQTDFDTGKVAQWLDIEANKPDGWATAELRMPRNRLTLHTGLLVEEYEVLQDVSGKAKRRIVSGHIIDFGATTRPQGA
jgi:hypothetical protein